MTKWDCPNCDLKATVCEPTGTEADRLLQIIRDLHAPHCPGLRAEAEVGEP